MDGSPALPEVGHDIFLTVDPTVGQRGLSSQDLGLRTSSGKQSLGLPGEERGTWELAFPETAEPAALCKAL